MKLTEASNSKMPQFKGVARSIEELIASIKNGRFTLDGRKLVVRGDLLLTRLGLTSLLGCPKYVSGKFDCSNNELKTLEGGPQEVGTYFTCDFNKLETLEGGPIKVGSDYSCCNNKLISLKGAPRVVDGDFYCSNNKLTSLKGCPRIIGGGFYCDENKLLTSLEGGPRYVGDHVDFHGCINLISLQNVHLHFPKVDGKFYLGKTGHKTSVLGFLLIQQLEGVVLDNLGAAAILNKYIETRNRDLLACALELVDAGYEDEAKL